MNDSQIPIGIDDRIRWKLLGFGSEELTDIPRKRQQQYREKLLAQLRDPITVHASSSTPITKTTRTIGLALFGILLTFLLAASVQTAIAGQRQSVRRDYAGQLMALALDLYEEDQEVLTNQSARAELLLPDRSYWARNNTEEKRMYACAQAVQSLMTARMGFPETSTVQLSNARSLLDSQLDRPTNVDLDFMFYLIAGKAAVEAADTNGGRGQTVLLEQIEAFSPEDAKLALENASAILDSELRNRFSESEYNILRSALLIDLGRAEIKSTPVSNALNQPAFQRHQAKVRERFDQSLKLLQAVDQADGRGALQMARALNNLLLLEHRGLRPPAQLASEEFEMRYREWQAQLDAAFVFEANDYPQRSNAINFERALCYSNLADLVSFARDMEIIAPRHPLLEESLALRNTAVDWLEQIPRICRTERHFENLVLNQSRSILTELKIGFDTEQGFVVPDSVRTRAAALELCTGDVLECRVGQFHAMPRVATAFCLPEKYSIERIQQFVEDNRNRIIPADQKWIAQIITDRGRPSNRPVP